MHSMVAVRRLSGVRKPNSPISCPGGSSTLISFTRNFPDASSRALLVKIKRDIENHVRGLLKNLGLVIGRAKFNVFAVRAEELIEGRPELIAAIRPLLEARNAVEQQVGELDRKVMKLARHDAQVRRFMTAPGIDPITALAFKATIDDPARFARSKSVGPTSG